MVFKRANPGCPCCPNTGGGFCACYPFNSDADNNLWDGLHLTSTYGNFGTAGKLGNASKHTGPQHHHHDHHSCFTPAEEGGLRIWFWLYVTTLPRATTAYQGVVTKGRFSTAGSPPANTFTGEWGIFWRTQSGSGTDINFVYKSDTVNLGVLHQVALSASTWYFVHWELNTDAKLSTLHINNISDSGTLGGTGTAGLVGVMQPAPGEPMRVGNNEDGEILGANSGSFLIDNLGFSHNSGSASDLYNTGTGLACNNEG